MKANITTFLLTAVVLLICSCKKSDLLTYESTSNIYFASALGKYTLNFYTAGTDSADVNFGWTSDAVKDTLMPVAVSITGPASDKDRSFIVSVDPASTAIAGKHYDTLPERFTFHAGKVIDTILIKIRRTDDLKNNSYTLNLILNQNENFATNLQSSSAGNGRFFNLLRYRLKLMDLLSKPKYWGDGTFGKFTKKKLFLMVELYGISPTYFFNAEPLPGEWQYLYVSMARYLSDKKAAGQTVYEDDGTEMTMGPFAR